MQPHVTPHPGRTPAKANIIDNSNYKLDMKVTEFRPEQFVLTIDKFIPEHGWISQQYFLTPEELDKIKKVLNDTGN